MHGSFVPRVHIPNGITIGSAIFVGLTVVSDRQTDRQTDRPRSHALHNDAVYNDSVFVYFLIGLSYQKKSYSPC